MQMNLDFLKKPLILGIALTILVTSLIGTGFYLSRKKPEEIQRPTSVKVEVDRVRKGSLTRETTVVGTLEASNSVVMKAQVKGLISKVNVLGGEAVKKGDVLFEIDDRTYKAQVKEAQALLTLAESTLEREKKLGEKNFGTAKKLEEAQAQFSKAQAQLEKAAKDLEDTKIVAPFEGTVGLHRISVGTPITADLDLITITDLDPMKVNFKMPSKFLSYLSLDQRIIVEVASYPDEKFEGRVEAIDSQIDAGAQSLAVQATIPNEKGLLKPGMFVRVRVIVGSKDNSLIVPEDAVVVLGDQAYVWKVIEHPEKPGLFVVFRVPVLTGLQDKDRIEIRRNLKEDDLIVTVGQQKVADGVPVSFDEPISETPADVKEPGKIIPQGQPGFITTLMSKVQQFFKDKFQKKPAAEPQKSEPAPKEDGAPEPAPAPKSEEVPAPEPAPATEPSPEKAPAAEPAPQAAPEQPQGDAAPDSATESSESAPADPAPVATPAKPSKPKYFNETNKNLKALFGTKPAAPDQSPTPQGPTQ